MQQRALTSSALTCSELARALDSADPWLAAAAAAAAAVVVVAASAAVATSRAGGSGRAARSRAEYMYTLRTAETVVRDPMGGGGWALST
jgi:hypothetical protein